MKQLDDCYDIISQKLILVTPKPSEKEVKSFRRLMSPKTCKTPPVTEPIEELENSQLSKIKIPFYQIEWDISRLQDLTKEICIITEISNEYATRFCAQNFEETKNLITSTTNHPEGVAVSISDLKIYVADYGNNRIIVADQNTNQIIQEISAIEIRWPQYLCVNEDFLYVSCYENNHLVKIDRLKGFVTTSVDTKQQITGVTVDNKGRLYTCEVNKRIISVRTLELEIIRSFHLNSSYVWPYTATWDIKIQYDKLYVLFENAPFPVQVFDLEGGLLSKLIGENRLDQSCHLSLDSNGNIAVSEYQMGRIKVFTNKGELMHSIRGLKFPTGVGFGSMGRIAFCNNQVLSLL